MDYGNVIVPYLDNEKIKKEADWFRKIDIKTLNSYLAIRYQKFLKYQMESLQLP